MAELPDDAEDSERRLQECLDRLASGDPNARDDLIAIACSRMQSLAHRMLLSYPAVRRHEGTDDVVQNAAMRLYRSLAEVHPVSVRHFSGLAALQIRRELLDLAKKHAGPESYAANPETNYARVGGEERAKVSDAPAGQIQIETFEHLVFARKNAIHGPRKNFPKSDPARARKGHIWPQGATDAKSRNAVFAVNSQNCVLVRLLAETH